MLNAAENDGATILPFILKPSLYTSYPNLKDYQSVIDPSGKGGKARVVPLNKEARKALQEWLEYRPPGNSQSVFTTQFGTPLQPRGVQLMLKEFGRRARVEVTPHQLRHTFAKNLIDHGVSLEKVAKLLGHSNLNTTMVYTIPSQADLAQAVEALVD